ncbi:MAG TPA: cysteine dioxygenase [Xanthomonadales bacterium]|nr:cysteine dioxygenase [Xanthomonadales bacterium]
MLALDFPGSDTLIAAIDRAVAMPGDRALTDELRATLCRLIRAHEVRLPDCVFEPVSDHYARRELYRSERLGYSVVAMTWGPGQGTPIHDHSGMWCVEGVWRGQLEITQYELLGADGEVWQFQPVGTLNAGTGSAGSLIPPHEYHTIRNPSSDEIAVSLHIYKDRIASCAVFERIDGNHYRRGLRTLCLDTLA